MFSTVSGPPKMLRMDNGPALVSPALQRFCDSNAGMVVRQCGAAGFGVSAVSFSPLCARATATGTAEFSCNRHSARRIHAAVLPSISRRPSVSLGRLPLDKNDQMSMSWVSG